jgi:hypothetical protein
MSKYLMKFTNNQASVMLEFNDESKLVKLDFIFGSLSDQQIDFFLQRFPKNIEIVEKWIAAKFKNIYINKVEEDLSFDTFYNTYAHKVSKKSVAEKIWNKMADIEKVKAIKHIQVYDQYLKTSNVNKKYPETYLNSEMWNN